MSPDNFISPTTSNACDGVVVPIPTLPSFKIVNLIASPAAKNN